MSSVAPVRSVFHIAPRLAGPKYSAFHEPRLPLEASAASLLRGGEVWAPCGPVPAGSFQWSGNRTHGYRVQIDRSTFELPCTTATRPASRSIRFWRTESDAPPDLHLGRLCRAFRTTGGSTPSPSACTAALGFHPSDPLAPPWRSSVFRLDVAGPASPLACSQAPPYGPKDLGLDPGLRSLERTHRRRLD